MKSLTITLPKKMPLTKRISETSARLVGWLQTLGVELNDEKSKLQLEKWELKNGEYSHHYSFSKNKPSSVGEINSRRPGLENQTSEIKVANLKVGDPIKDVPFDS